MTEPQYKSLCSRLDLQLIYLILETTISKIYRACLAKEKWSLNFCHSIFITHHSSLKFSHPFAFIIQFLSLNIFHTIHGPHNCYCVRPLLFCYPRTIFPISISLFLISPSPSALSLSQSRNPNPEKCLNLPRLVSTIITGEQRRSLRRVQRRDLTVVTHLLATPTRKPKPIKISFSPRQDHHHSPVNNVELSDMYTA